MPNKMTPFQSSMKIYLTALMGRRPSYADYLEGGVLALKWETRDSVPDKDRASGAKGPGLRYRHYAEHSRGFASSSWFRHVVYVSPTPDQFPARRKPITTEKLKEWLSHATIRALIIQLKRDYVSFTGAGKMVPSPLLGVLADALRDADAPEEVAEGVQTASKWARGIMRRMYEIATVKVVIDSMGTGD